MFISFLSISQIDPNDVEIVRDSFGVPHIYAKTDAELAYGLAWAHAEDDFKTIQEAYLAGNALLSKHIGIRAAPIDFLYKLIRTDDIDFIKLISLPQKIEKLVRNEIIKIIINKVGIAQDNLSQVGIIFFNKEIIKLSKDQLKNALVEIFSDKTDDVFIENLSNKIMNLIKLEIDFVKNNYKSNIESIINENDESYITLWKKGS